MELGKKHQAIQKALQDIPRYIDSVTRFLAAISTEE
jgi:hypothetical protein